MDIKHIKYIIEIAKCGSMNQAANLLYISQSTLSGILSSMQKELGYTIFETGPHGCKLTEEGKMFIRSAENILMEEERMKNVPLRLKKSHDLSICCTYSSSMMKLFLEYTNRTAGKNQDRFKETGIIHALHDAITHRYRLTFFYAFNKRIEFHRQRLKHYSFVAEQISGPVPLGCMMSSQNELKSSDSVTISELKSRRIVCFEDFSCEDWLGAIGISTAESGGSEALRVFDRGGLLETIQNGNYIAIVPRHPNDPYHFTELYHCPILDAQDELHWYVCYSGDYQMNDREKEFYRKVIEAMQKTYPSHNHQM